MFSYASIITYVSIFILISDKTTFIKYYNFANILYKNTKVGELRVPEFSANDKYFSNKNIST